MCFCGGVYETRNIFTLFLVQETVGVQRAVPGREDNARVSTTDSSGAPYDNPANATRLLACTRFAISRAFYTTRTFADILHGHLRTSYPLSRAFYTTRTFADILHGHSRTCGPLSRAFYTTRTVVPRRFTLLRVSPTGRRSRTPCFPSRALCGSPELSRLPPFLRAGVSLPPVCSKTHRSL